MKKFIVITGANSSVLSVSLLDVLTQIKDGDKYNWKLLFLEANGKLKEGTVLELEDKINNSKSGYPVSFFDLFELAQSFDQVIEVLIIGDIDTQKLRRYDSDSNMYEKCNFSIELVDSSYWEINTNNEHFIKNINMNLEGVKDKGIYPQK